MNNIKQNVTDRTFSYATVARLKRRIAELQDMAEYPKVWFEEIVTDNSMLIQCILELPVKKRRIKASAELTNKQINNLTIKATKDLLLNKLAVDRFNKAVKYWEMVKIERTE